MPEIITTQPDWTTAPDAATYKTALDAAILELDAEAGAAREELDGLGTAAYEDVGTAEGDIPVLGSGGRLARATTPKKTTAALTDAATVTPDLSSADTFTLTITEARNLGDATLPGVGAWPITVTGNYALSTHVNWVIDPNGLAADPATGTRVLWMYSLDGTSKGILIAAV